MSSTTERDTSARQDFYPFVVSKATNEQGGGGGGCDCGVWVRPTISYALCGELGKEGMWFVFIIDR